MNRKLLSTLMAGSFILPLALGACSFNFGEARKWREEASKKAVEYVSDKYDIDEDDIKVLNTFSKQSYDLGNFASSNTPTTYVELKYDDIKFYARVNPNDKDDSQYTDSFQKDIICEAIEEVIEAQSDLDIERIDIRYAFLSRQEPEYLVHEIYDVTDKASIEEKAAALCKVFNYQYDAVPGDSKKGEYEVNIVVSYITDDVYSMTEEMDYLTNDYLLFDCMNLTEIAFKSRSDMKEVPDDDFSYLSFPNGYTILMNGISMYHKGGPGYLGERTDYLYQECNIGGYTCVITGCSPEEVTITTEEETASTLDIRGSVWKFASSKITVDIPSGAIIQVYLDADDYDKNVSIASHSYRYNYTGDLKDSYQVIQIDDFYHSAEGYYYLEVGASSDEELDGENSPEFWIVTK